MTKIKLALVSTIGGHFEQMINLNDFYNKYTHFWITNKNAQTESALINEKKYYIEPAHFKRPWSYLPHFLEIFKIFKIEKPTHILSTGSGRTCFVPFLFSKIFKIEFIFIETFSRVYNYTIFAKFLSKINYPYFVQWDYRLSKNSTYIGPIFKATKNATPKKDAKKNNYVFVTLGTRNEPFPRLLEVVEKLINNNIITDHVVVQAGYTRYKSNHMEIFNFCQFEQIDNYIQNAKFIITQESAGICTKCLRYNKKFVVMPRDYRFKELPSKSDMKEDLQYKLQELGYTKVVKNINELSMAIEKIEELKTGFKFDNSNAMLKLNQAVRN